MSKYRFKNKEEFIRDGLWDEEYNCPDGWNFDGEMNKYLGIDVPDEHAVNCDEGKIFKYDGWLFQNTDYVLKEQQEYFDDLSQHIGRYIRALVDNPHSGGVKKGEIGKIISKCDANFPSQKYYSCTNALNKGYIGVKYELLPENYSPEQEVKEPNIEFIPGKWYKWYQKDHGNYHYGKVKRINTETDTLVVIPWIMECTDYTYSGAFNLSKTEQIQEISIEEIQEFLPDSHSDKITSDEFKKGEYIVIIKMIESYSKDFTSNYIYKQKEDYKYLRSELDNYGSTTNGWETIGKKDSHTWRYATQEEIDEYEKRGKPYDVTELHKKQLSMKEIQEECKKRFPIGCTYISIDGIKYVLKDDSDTYRIFGNRIWAHSGGGCLYADGKYATLVSLPEENITGVPKYVKCNSYFGNEYVGKIYDTSIDKPEKISSNTWYGILITCGRLEDGSFEISNKEAYEKQKSHIPEYIECTETQESYFIKGNIYKVIDSSSLISARLVSNIELSQIPAGTSLFCLMEINGKKYWKPSTKEAYDQQKTLTHEFVSRCFPADKNIFNYDEVSQYLSTAFDYWKNVPKFVEKEFDIYGPTPDIE